MVSTRKSSCAQTIREDTGKAMSSMSSSMRIRLTGCKRDGLETFKVVLMFEGSVIEIEEELR